MVVVGAGARADRAVDELLRSPPRGLELVGLVDEKAATFRAHDGDLPVFAVRDITPTRIFVRRVTAARRRNDGTASLFAVAEIDDSAPRISSVRAGSVGHAGERCLAGGLLLVLSPLLLLFALAIKVDSR